MSTSKELTQYANDKNYGIIKSKGGYQLIYNDRVNPKVFKTKLLAVIYLENIN